jgi:hypothetical protein
MKIFINKLGAISLFLIFILFMSCGEKEATKPFGNTVVYIPQSTVAGGVNLNYLVPSINSLDTNTNNFRVDTLGKKVNVFLGVTCSGKQQALNGFSVSVSTRADTINQLIANGLIKVAPNAAKPVVLLPASAYTLPTTVSVPSLAYATGFYLSINTSTLKTYAGQKVALCVVISSPSMYTLSPINNQVIIIIDVDSLKLP